MTRITPITHLLPEYIQEELFRTTGKCGACGWCKNQKGLLKPSVLKFGDQKKTVCWFKQDQYYSLDEHTCSVIMEYIKLHQQLLARNKS